MPLTGGLSLRRDRFDASRDFVDAEPAAIDDRVVLTPSQLEQVAVAAQRCEAEAQRPGLACTEELALAAELEVALGEHKTVRRLHHRLEPRACAVRQLVLRARDQQAVRLFAAPSYTPTQLMEL